jgi:hypothetical protein
MERPNPGIIYLSCSIALAGCGKIILAQQHFDGGHFGEKSGLSG